MAETLLVYQRPVVASDGTSYEARACGAPMSGSTWEGWIEFVPLTGGQPVRSGRETTQPNRVDAEYWATGLTQVYLEGALRRALDAPPTVLVAPPQPSVFSGPAPRPAVTEATAESVLDPFVVYEKGEALLRRQLGALAAWHLMNIVTAYELSDEPVAALNRRSAQELIEMIVSAVRSERKVIARRR
jgi:hypothetical protein